MSAHNCVVKEDTELQIWAREALTPEGWRKGVTVTVNASGRIEEVAGDTPATGYQVGTLIPAPANLHSHAFQRAMAGLTERRGPDPSDSFWTWRRLMYRFLDQLTPEDVKAITSLVMIEMLEAGFGSLGEFHYLHHQVDGSSFEDMGEMSGAIAQAAAETGMGLTLLPVLYEVGGCDGRPLGAGQRRFGSTVDSFAKLVEASKRHLKALPEDTGHGIAPHSLRAVSIDGLKHAITLASNGPIHMHVAEQVAEIDEVQAARGARPVEWLMDNASIGPHWCMIHLTHMTEAETKAVADSGAVAGLCPLTESSLGDGIFNARSFASAGGRFGIGSDSNIRISLAEELRTLEYSQRLHHRARAVLATGAKSTGRVLLEGAAHGGAQVLRRASGAIAPGLWADLAALDQNALDLQGRSGDVALDTWIFAGDNRMVADVWSAGRHVVSEGRHHNREQIEACYRTTLARLTDQL